MLRESQLPYDRDTIPMSRHSIACPEYHYINTLLLYIFFLFFNPKYKHLKQYYKYRINQLLPTIYEY